MVEVLQSKDFDKEVRNCPTPVIIDFYADWCGPCQMMGPLFDELSKEYQGRLKFVKLDTDEAMQISSEFDISTIPCLVMVSKGKVVGRFEGYMPKELLGQKINEVLSKLG